MATDIQAKDRVIVTQVWGRVIWVKGKGKGYTGDIAVGLLLNTISGIYIKSGIYIGGHTMTITPS